jgi:hypothetical protein
MAYGNGCIIPLKKFKLKPSITYREMKRAIAVDQYLNSRVQERIREDCHKQDTLNQAKPFVSGYLTCSLEDV